MNASLEFIFGFLYVFTTGRILFAHQQVRAIAEKRGFTKLVKHCNAVMAHCNATRALERRWAGEPARADSNPAATKIDVLVDRTLSAIRDAAVAQTRGAAPDDPIHAEVADFLKRIFPVDLNAVTSQPYVEELATVNDIVKLLKGELAQAVKELGLGRLVKRLADLAVQYRDALEAPPPSLLAHGQLRASLAEDQGLLCETVAIITGAYHERTPEGTAARLELLEPILRQNEAIGQYKAARRQVHDVNPETGEEEPNAPGAEEGPGGGQGNG